MSKTGRRPRGLVRGQVDMGHGAGVYIKTAGVGVMREGIEIGGDRRGAR